MRPGRRRCAALDRCCGSKSGCSRSRDGTYPIIEILALQTSQPFQSALKVALLSKADFHCYPCAGSDVVSAGTVTVVVVVDAGKVLVVVEMDTETLGGSVFVDGAGVTIGGVTVIVVGEGVILTVGPGVLTVTVTFGDPEDMASPTPQPTINITRPRITAITIPPRMVSLSYR